MSDNIAHAVSSGYTDGGNQSGASSSDIDQKLHVGFAAMDPEKQREIARMGGIERGRQMHEAAKRGESGTGKKSR